MIALEEKNFQSIKTDASLYNGLPTDTGTMCHSAEVISSTPHLEMQEWEDTKLQIIKK